MNLVAMELPGETIKIMVMLNGHVLAVVVPVGMQVGAMVIVSNNNNNAIPEDNQTSTHKDVSTMANNNPMDIMAMNVAMVIVNDAIQPVVLLVMMAKKAHNSNNGAIVNNNNNSSSSNNNNVNVPTRHEAMAILVEQH